MPISSKEERLKLKYAEIPEPRYKKKKKKTYTRSDHKHHYEPCLFKGNIYSYVHGKKEPWMYGGTYCVICGRIGDINIGASKIINDDLPIFNLGSKLFTKKSVSLEGTNEG